MCISITYTPTYYTYTHPHSSICNTCDNLFLVHSHMLGKGMEYMPGAASLTATHKGKVKNLRLAALRETSQSLPPQVSILNLEKATKQFDHDQEKASGEQAHMADYKTIGHPYMRGYSLSNSFSWVVTISPLMSQVFAEAEFIEVDVTYNAASVLEYLLNVVTFNYTTMECESMHRVVTRSCV